MKLPDGIPLLHPLRSPVLCGLVDHVLIGFVQAAAQRPAEPAAAPTHERRGPMIPTCPRHPSIRGWASGAYSCAACAARYRAGARPGNEPAPAPPLAVTPAAAPAPPAAAPPAAVTKKKPRKVATTIYIRPDQEADLKALSERTKVPVAEYVRQGIAAVLDLKREPSEKTTAAP